MPIQPRIDDPSKPSHSLKVSAYHRSIGKEQCCQLPSMSTNFRSTICAWLSFAIAKKSSAVIRAVPLRRVMRGAGLSSVPCESERKHNGSHGRFSPIVRATFLLRDAPISLGERGRADE